MIAFINPITKPIGTYLSFLYSFVPSLGLCIILLTISVLLLLYPFSHKQSVSTVKQQELQPKVKEIRKKYKDNSQEMNQRIMKLYKDEGVNPMAGCLPLLLQMPVFFSLFSLFRNIQQFIPTNSKLYSDLCGKVTNVAKCKVENSTKTNFLGLDLFSNITSQKTLIAALPYIIIVLLLMASAYAQVSLSTSRATQTMPLMKYMKYIAPFMAGIFSISLSTALNLYLLTSSMWRFGQQEYIYKYVIPKHKNNDKKKGK